MKIFRRAFNALLTLCSLALFISLSACGGDSGDKQSTVTSVGGLSLAISADTIEISSSGNTPVTLTANAQHLDGTPVVGTQISFSTSSGQITATNEGLTDEQGTATALLNISSAALLEVLITASAEGAEASIALPVVGTTLTISVLPASSTNQATPVELMLLDSAGQPIVGEAVSLSSSSGNAFSNATPITDSNGKATTTLTLSNEGTDTLSASALNATVLAPPQQITVTKNLFTLEQTDDDGNPIFQPVPLSESGYAKLTLIENLAPVDNESVSLSLTRGLFVENGAGFIELETDASGEVLVEIEAEQQAGETTITATATGQSTSLTIEFVSDAPQLISLTALPASINVGETTSISAQVTDAVGNPVPNTVVLFRVNDPGGGTLGQGEVTTDETGTAVTTFTPHLSTQTVDAVEISGTVKSATNVTNTVFLTVSEAQLGVTIGTGNTLYVTKEETSFLVQYIARVTDINGLGVEGAILDVSIFPIAYHKGLMIPKDTQGLFEGNVGFDSESFARWELVASTSPACPNEDLNRNGLLDDGEDVNGDGILTPGQVASLGPELNGRITPTDALGETLIDVRYPQDHSGWVRYEMTATITTDQNTPVHDTAQFWLPLSAEENDDIQLTPPNWFSPYGTSNDCSNLD